MRIILNGNALEVQASVNVSDLLKRQGYQGKLVAVALNGLFLPKIKYEDTFLQDNDKIEIVAPMQGG